METGVPASASDVLRDLAQRDPDRVALEVGDDRLTYAELDASSTGAASALVERLGPGRHHVVLSIESTRALLIASMALARAGLVSVPVDPAAPVELLRRVAADVDAALIVSDRAAVDAGDIDVIDPLDLVGPPPAGWQDVPPGEYVSIAFTSGSTGEPKGILVSAAQRPVGATGSDLSRYGQFGEAPRAGLIAIGSTNVAEATLQTVVSMGGTIVAYEIRRVGLTGFADWFRTANVFGMYAVPTLLRHLLATLDDGDVLEGMTQIFLGGEASTWEDIAEIRAHLPPEAVVVNMFGSTESGGSLRYVVTAQTPLGTGPLPLGAPIPGRTVELLDEDGQPVPDGEVGEIVVTGRETALGYWKRPDETAETFTDLGDGTRRVRTGDLGRLLPDGNIEYRGRRDHMVKIAGNRVELGHVEATLRLLDGVADAAATTYVDDAGEVRLTASAVPADGRRLHPSALRLELARRLPGPMLPDGIAILEELPRLPGGKVDRLRLPVARTLPRAASAPPETDLERRLLKLWQRVLGVDGLGVEDDFFSVGGDSLRGARIIVSIDEELGYDLPVSVLVEAPTVRQLAAYLETRTDWSPLVPVRSEGSGPTLFVVHDGGGDVVYTRLLSSLLPEGFPIYGLRGQALEGRAIPERSVEELADRYLTAIRTVSPRGPYFLYGWSAGGTIAFEIARRLRCEDEDVPVLVLGDTPAPGAEVSFPAPESARERAAVRVRELREMPPARAALHALRLGAWQLAFRVGRVWKRLTGGDRRAAQRLAATEELLRAALAGGPAVPIELRVEFALRTYGALAAAYSPDGLYDGPLTVLRSSVSGFPVEPWSDYLTAPHREVPIDGRHEDFREEAVLRQIAAALAEEIALATTESEVDAALPV